MANAVTKDLYGVGFSPLSIKNKKYAEPEELLSEKSIGLFAIYQEDGNVLSADQIQREKKHLTDFANTCINDRTVGKIYKLNIDDNLVQNIIATQNLFANTVEISNVNKPFHFFRLSIDADCFVKEDSAYFDPSTITATLTFSLTKNGVAKKYQIEESVTNLDRRAFAMDYTVLDELSPDAEDGDNSYTIILNSLVITLSEDFDDTKYGYVIRDILFAIQ